MAARMTKAEMDQRDYELELVRMEFMDGVSEIAREAMESQREIWNSHFYEDSFLSESFALSNISDWVTNQSKFITELINNWKGNEPFRHLVSENMANLDTIGRNMDNLEFINQIMPIITTGHAAHVRQEYPNFLRGSEPDANVLMLEEILNRCLREILDREYTPEQRRSGAINLPMHIRFSLINNMINSFICNGMPQVGAAVNLLPFSYLSGNGGSIKPTLTYFRKYFGCYCQCLTGLLQVNVGGRRAEVAMASGGGGRDDLSDDDKKNRRGSYGGKKTRKHRRRITARQRGVDPF